MNTAEMRDLVSRARVGRLATVRPEGAPHVVPCVFALEGSAIYTPVDRKPKRSTALQRLRNIEHDARATLLVDRYDESWERLWWVRADGRARIIDAGDEYERAVRALVDKYPQYRDDPVDDRVVALDVERWSGWAATGS